MRFNAFSPFAADLAAGAAVVGGSSAAAAALRFTPAFATGFAVAPASPLVASGDFAAGFAAGFAAAFAAFATFGAVAAWTAFGDAASSLSLAALARWRAATARAWPRASPRRALESSPSVASNPSVAWELRSGSATGGGPAEAPL